MVDSSNLWRKVPFLEIACFGPQPALIAAQNGTSRTEFCKDAHLSGATPLLSDSQALMPQITIPLYVIIRPQGGNIIVSDQERIQMSRTAKQFDDVRADGFVFRMLDEQNRVRCLGLM